MKKNSIFGIRNKGLIASFIGATLFILFGCANPAKGSSSGDQNNSKASISFDFTNAKLIGTTKVTGGTSRSASRSADPDEKSTLVVVNEDGSVNLDAIKFDKQVLAQLDPDTAILPEVIDVYSCDNGDSATRGTYIVFNNKIDYLKYADGSAAEKIGQVLFVNKDGKVFDVLNENGNADRRLATWTKSIGDEYIRFASNGSIFMIGEELSVSKRAMYCWNPKTGLKKFILDDNVNRIRNFEITDDGAWILVNASLNNSKKSNVYAIKVNSTNDPILLYESRSDQGECIRTIAVDNADRVFFYVNDYQNRANEEAGLYIVDRINDNYSKGSVIRYKVLNWNSVNNFVRSIIKEQGQQAGAITLDDIKNKMTDDAYTSVLNFIKSFTHYHDEMDFTLEYYKDKTAVDCVWIDDDGNELYPATKDFSMLYKEDKNGQALKNEEALKYLLETPTLDSNYDPEDMFSGPTLFFREFRDECVQSNNRAHTYKTNCGPFPIDVCLVKKGTNEPVLEEYELVYLKSDYADAQEGLFITNAAGVWSYNDIFKKTNQKNEAGDYIYERSHALLRNILNEYGTFTADPYVGNLENTELYVMEDGSPYKLIPFAVNSNAIVALSKDRKTMYYQKGRDSTTIDLLANYASKSEIGSIHSFNLDETTLLINASLASGSGYTTVSIDLDTKAVTKLSLDKQLDSLVNR